MRNITIHFLYYARISCEIIVVATYVIYTMTNDVGQHSIHGFPYRQYKDHLKQYRNTTASLSQLRQMCETFSKH